MNDRSMRTVWALGLAAVILLALTAVAMVGLPH